MSSPLRHQVQYQTILLIAICVLLSSLPGRGLAATAADIAGCIKPHLVGLDGHTAQRLMAGHFQRMHLLDAQGIWQAPAYLGRASALPTIQATMRWHSRDLTRLFGTCNKAAAKHYETSVNVATDR